MFLFSEMQRTSPKDDRRALAFVTATALAALMCVLPQPAEAASAGSPEARPILSAAFSVRGTNGYRFDLVRMGRVATVVVSERRPPIPTFSRGGAPLPASRDNGAASIYRVRAPGTDPHRIDVRLGRLGRIAVSFEPSGRTRATRLSADSAGSPCGRAVRLVRRLGSFVGTVEFRGESGYTSVRATRVWGSVGTPLSSGCAGASLAPRGLRLTAVQPHSSTRFEARTTAAGASFLAAWRERLGDGVVVLRRAYAGAPRSAFAVAADLGSARVTPPAPFTGSARYLATADGAGRWTGSLAATFPGASIPMTGPGFRARLLALR